MLTRMYCKRNTHPLLGHLQTSTSGIVIADGKVKSHKASTIALQRSNKTEAHAGSMTLLVLISAFCILGDLN